MGDTPTIRKTLDELQDALSDAPSPAEELQEEIVTASMLAGLGAAGMLYTWWKNRAKKEERYATLDQRAKQNLRTAVAEMKEDLKAAWKALEAINPNADVLTIKKQAANVLASLAVTLHTVQTRMGAVEGLGVGDTVEIRPPMPAPARGRPPGAVTGSGPRSSNRNPEAEALRAIIDARRQLGL